MALQMPRIVTDRCELDSCAGELLGELSNEQCSPMTMAPKKSKAPERKYKASITYDGAVFSGPYRTSAEQAAHDWDALARALLGEYATFNFPRQGERGFERA